MASRDGKIYLPEEAVAEDIFEKVRLALPSLHGEAIVDQSLVYLFCAPMTCNPSDLQWTYLAPVVVAAVRTKEKSNLWTMHLYVYLSRFGRLAWKTKLPYECDYSAPRPNFHVLSLEGKEVILGLWHQCDTASFPFLRTLRNWIKEGPTVDEAKLSQRRRRRNSISKPALFLVVQFLTPVEDEKVLEDFKKAKKQLVTTMESLSHPPSEIDEGIGTSQRKDMPHNFPLCQLPIPPVATHPRPTLPKETEVVKKLHYDEDEKERAASITSKNSAGSEHNDEAGLERATSNINEVNICYACSNYHESRAEKCTK